MQEMYAARRDSIEDGTGLAEEVDRLIAALGPAVADPWVAHINKSLRTDSGRADLLQGGLIKPAEMEWARCAKTGELFPDGPLAPSGARTRLRGLHRGLAYRAKKKLEHGVSASIR